MINNIWYNRKHTPSFNSNVQLRHWTLDKRLLESTDVRNITIQFYTFYVYESSVGAGGRINAFVCLSIYSATTKRCVQRLPPDDSSQTKFMYKCIAFTLCPYTMCACIRKHNRACHKQGRWSYLRLGVVCVDLSVQSGHYLVWQAGRQADRQAYRQTDRQQLVYE